MSRQLGHIYSGLRSQGEAPALAGRAASSDSRAGQACEISNWISTVEAGGGLSSVIQWKAGVSAAAPRSRVGPRARPAILDDTLLFFFFFSPPHLPSKPEDMVLLQTVISHVRTARLAVCLPCLAGTFPVRRIPPPRRRRFWGPHVVAVVLNGL